MGITTLYLRFLEIGGIVVSVFRTTVVLLSGNYVPCYTSGGYRFLIAEQTICTWLKRFKSFVATTEVSSRLASVNGRLQIYNK
jgi:hypothetical protein